MMLDVTIQSEPALLMSYDQVCDDMSADDRSMFDYMDEHDREDVRLFEYNDSWYDLSEFEIIGDGVLADAGWSGAFPQSAFDAILVDLGDPDTVEYGESVIVGHASW